MTCSADDVFSVWASEFDYFYERVQAAVFVMMLHPQIMGRGHRLLMLERLIEHMRRPGIEFRQLGEVASAWRAANPFEQAQNVRDARGDST